MQVRGRARGGVTGAGGVVGVEGGCLQRGCCCTFLTGGCSVVALCTLLLVSRRGRRDAAARERCVVEVLTGGATR